MNLTQLQSYLSNYDRGYMDQHAIRYLHKREPELWANIVEVTNFLPIDVRAKQRCWHILNDVYERPTCPVTGEFSKWRDYYYAKFSSHKAKAKSPEWQDAVQKPWADDETRKEKVRATFKENRTAGNHIIVDSPFNDPKIQEKCKATMLERYGVENLFYSDEHQAEFQLWQQDPRKKAIATEKAHNTKVELGIYRTPDQITAQEHYYKEVAFWTEWNWYYFQKVINPNGYNRALKEYHVDHIYSQSQGFKNGVDPKILGHYTNLQMMWCTENNGKCGKCDQTLDQLYEKYYIATTNQQLI